MMVTICVRARLVKYSKATKITIFASLFEFLSSFFMYKFLTLILSHFCIHPQKNMKLNPSVLHLQEKKKKIKNGLLDIVYSIKFLS